MSIVKPLRQSRRFYDVGSDVNWLDYGGNYANIQRYRTFEPYDSDRPYNGTVLNVVQFINWEDATGDVSWRTFDALGDCTKCTPCRYAVSCTTIDMAFYTRSQINSALECHGQPPLPIHKHDMPTPLQLAYVMTSYGHGDTDTLYGNNAYRLLALGKRRLV